MGFWKDLRTLCAETPDERRQREREGRILAKRKAKTAPTEHPDDHYGFAGLDAYNAKLRKGKH